MLKLPKNIWRNSCRSPSRDILSGSPSIAAVTDREFLVDTPGRILRETPRKNPGGTSWWSSWSDFPINFWKKHGRHFWEEILGKFLEKPLEIHEEKSVAILKWNDKTHAVISKALLVEISGWNPDGTSRGIPVGPLPQNSERTSREVSASYLWESLV